jgi:hypothetical protein
MIVCVVMLDDNTFVEAVRRHELEYVVFGHADQVAEADAVDRLALRKMIDGPLPRVPTEDRTDLLVGGKHLSSMTIHETTGLPAPRSASHPDLPRSGTRRIGNPPKS